MFVEFFVLYLSKTVMYDFFKIFLKLKYQNNLSLMYTDTDSLKLEVFTNKIYDDIRQDICGYNTFNYKNNKITL